MSHGHYPVLWIGQTAVVAKGGPAQVGDQQGRAQGDNAFGGNAATTADTGGGAA